jgi:hypothetical protein
MKSVIAELSLGLSASINRLSVSLFKAVATALLRLEFAISLKCTKRAEVQGTIDLHVAACPHNTTMHNGQLSKTRLSEKQVEL